jgi:hypothetical protein
MDTLGHDWKRLYNENGEPLMLMQCERCERVWSPMETLSDIGACPMRENADV